MPVVEETPTPTISFDGFAARLMAVEQKRQTTAAAAQTTRLSELTALALCCVDTETNTVVDSDFADEAAQQLLPAALIKRTATGELDSGLVETFAQVVTHELSNPRFVAVALIPNRPESATSDENRHCQLGSYWHRNAGRDLQDARRLLSLSHRLVLAEAAEEQQAAEIETLAEQVDSTIDEISLLHFLAQNLQVSRDTFDLAKLCLSRLRESLNCEGAVVWIAGETGASQFHRDGQVPLDELELALMLARFDDHPWPQPLVLNHSAQLPDGPATGIASLIVVPIQRGEERVGWTVAINANSSAGFGTVETGLLQSVAVSLSTHLQNAAIVAEQEELLLSFVRSLVSSLDAKDRYTRGHSERVAMIARRLGIEIGLTEQEIEDIYLAGLLHDVGKIGVDDAILRKPGKLTDDEFDEIKKHPAIGYQILGGIKRLQHILPGVRSHHEAFDGSGYPDGLSGYHIPTMARVLAVADSYDAMGSDRPYRNGMPLDRLESILSSGRGTQWDADIIDAYFACRDDIREICLDWTARQVDSPKIDGPKSTTRQLQSLQRPTDARAQLS